MGHARPAALALLAALALSGCPAPDREGEQPACPPGQTFCGGTCRDPASFQVDPENCGACRVACGHGTCAGGACQCDGGATLCSAQNPRCRDIETDTESCGDCGVQCGVGTCAAGVCQCEGATRCDGQGPVCRDTSRDPDNCGDCGRACLLTNEACVGGGCQCPPSLPDRCPTVEPAACVSLDSDERNCGSCGNACTAGQTCCARGCRTTGSDRSNCGACGNVCAAEQDCCAGGCTTTSTDANNCGACGRVCPPTASCVAGACRCPAGPLGGCGTRCCPGGDACCAGDACQTQHSNGPAQMGLGQSYFDCHPLGTYGFTAAQAAALAWQPGGTGVQVFCASAFCLGWQTGSACTVWCYGTGTDPLRGRVHLNDIGGNACICPTTLSPTWN